MWRIWVFDCVFVTYRARKVSFAADVAVQGGVNILAGIPCTGYARHPKDAPASRGFFCGPPSTALCGDGAACWGTQSVEYLH